ncbi:MAG: winged helix-turn-helix domain-containing protein [ANME-2 cluster archaeon]|nr:winged helix-turn-helix domain-containing protein [ANME-2 cluster archaeon]
MADINTNSTINKKPRKSKKDISVAILTITKGGANKTRIVYKANLDFIMADKYLDLLQQNGLLETAHNSTYYQITKNGRDYLDKIQDTNTEV